MLYESEILISSYFLSNLNIFFNTKSIFSHRQGPFKLCRINIIFVKFYSSLIQSKEIWSIFRYLFSFSLFYYIYIYIEDYLILYLLIEFFLLFIFNYSILIIFILSDNNFFINNIISKNLQDNDILYFFCITFFRNFQIYFQFHVFLIII